MVNAPGKNYVCKRDGRTEAVHLDKITSRIQKLCYGLNMDFVDPVSITLKVINGLYPGVTTVELDTLAGETAALMSTLHPDYAILAARIVVSNLHKQTKKHFSEVIDNLHNATHPKTGAKTPMISDFHHSIIMKNANRLNSSIIYDRDFSYNYFAFKLLERDYLLKINGETVERPQHMLMRVAIGIHEEDLDAAIETYNYMSEKYFIHASSTLQAAATPDPILCSSYLVAMPDDSLDGIYDCVTQCALIGNTGGDIGINIQNIRAKGTDIAGTNGVSNGLVPMLRVFNNSACYVSTDASESQTIYLEPWHPDILEFLNLKKATGMDEYRARNLSYALWIPDIFMQRVKENKMWSLMCPHRSPGLPDLWGPEFEKKYLKFEAEKNYVKQIPAIDLWRAICLSQMESGTPHILYKDACNKKSNQQNLGTIKGGGFCTEIIQFTSDKEIGVCAHATVALNMFVNPERDGYDFDKLKEVVKRVTKNLNKIIDVSSYPLPQAKTSNFRHRPIAVGVQGLADTFVLLRMAYDSEEARRLNAQIFETVYYGALEASSEIAERDGTYTTYKGSPISKGLLQYDLWDTAPTSLWDWTSLKQRIAKHGVRNSLLTAVVSTNRSAYILENNKSTECYESYVDVRRVSGGEFQVVNHHLLKDLTDKGLWNDAIKDQIIANKGSIQNIPEISNDLKKIYKTVWEISQKVVINMAADRAPFIDHSQAMNICIPSPNYQIMDSVHFYAWNKGLKTGMYRLKINSMVSAKETRVEKTKIAIDQENGVEKESNEEAILACSLQNPGACEMCSA